MGRHVRAGPGGPRRGPAWALWTGGGPGFRGITRKRKLRKSPQNSAGPYRGSVFHKKNAGDVGLAGRMRRNVPAGSFAVVHPDEKPEPEHHQATLKNVGAPHVISHSCDKTSSREGRDRPAPRKEREERQRGGRRLSGHAHRRATPRRAEGLFQGDTRAARQGVRMQVVPSRPARGRQLDSQPARPDRRDADRQRQEHLLPVARPARRVVHRRRLSPARTHARPGAGPAGQGECRPRSSTAVCRRSNVRASTTWLMAGDCVSCTSRRNDCGPTISCSSRNPRAST